MGYFFEGEKGYGAKLNKKETTEMLVILVIFSKVLRGQRLQINL